MQATKERQAYIRNYRATTRRVSVTFTEAEYKVFAELAKSNSKKPTTLAKDIITASMEGKAFTPEMIRDELSELRFLLRNVANNLNQIAHHSNTIRRVVDDNAVLAEVQKMEEAVYDFVNNRLQTKTT